MKKRGVTPITDLARVYALTAGVDQINTQERLKAANKKDTLSKSGLMDLSDAFEFLSTVRISHQARQIKANQQADNYPCGVLILHCCSAFFQTGKLPGLHR